MVDHSRHRQKSSPSATHKALRPVPSSSIDGGRPPKQADTFFKGVEGVYGPQHTTMLWRWIVDKTKECIEGHTLPQHPQNYNRLLRGLLPINLTCQHEAQCLVWGVRWAFPLSTAMIVTVFCSVLEHEPLFPVEPRIVGIARKLLSRARWFLHCTKAQT